MPTIPHILIADDHDDVRRLLERIVTRTYAKVRITTATNGAMALEAYRSSKPDLLITNNNMPLLAGLALIQTLRAEQAKLPIIMESSDPELELPAYSAGATRFIAKPFPLARLQHMLLELLPHS